MRLDWGVPYGFDRLGRTRRAEGDRHLRDLIEAVLFTAPGERVMRPTFGCGLRELLFEPNSDVLAAATQLQAQGALQQWLGDRADFLNVEVRAVDARLEVEITYRPRDEDEWRTVVLEGAA